MRRVWAGMERGLRVWGTTACGTRKAWWIHQLPSPLLSSPFPSLPCLCLALHHGHPAPLVSFVSHQSSRCGRSQPRFSFHSSPARLPFFSPTHRSCPQRISGHFFFVLLRSFRLLLATGLRRLPKFGAFKRHLLRFRQLAFCGVDWRGARGRDRCHLTLQRIF